ncbi:MAG: 50S ribosomal protein L29 [Elusimicrobia bacterium]|nr:50S ribosomal protein L29 [Elusimicrobiota bacterium]
MKAKEKENLKSLSAQELASELRQARERLFKARFRHRLTPLKDPLELRRMRRQIARLRTFLGQKEQTADGGS